MNAPGRQQVDVPGLFPKQSSMRPFFPHPPKSAPMSGRDTCVICRPLSDIYNIIQMMAASRKSHENLGVDFIL